MAFLSYLIKGLSLGSVYAIIALGYTMVYGIAKMLNFAHGDVIMIGGYAAYISTVYLGFPPVIGLIIAILVCTLLGIVIEKLAYKPLRSADSLSVLITAIGVSYFSAEHAPSYLGFRSQVFSIAKSMTSISLFDGQLVLWKPL